MKSSGIPTYNGDVIATSAVITKMSGSNSPVVKVFPRTIGCLLKQTGINSLSILLNCNLIISDVTRANIENYMNLLNERLVNKRSELFIDDNIYKNCIVKNISYSEKFVNNYLIYDIDFELSDQNTNVQTTRQLVPGKLYDLNTGRKMTFTVGSQEFDFWHNTDLVRNLEVDAYVKVYDKDLSYYYSRTVGGVEKIVCKCWVRATSEDQHDGWKQTIGAYIYNMMLGPLGKIGSLSLGGNTINYCLMTGVELEEVYPTSARYSVTFITSLQC
jgi:hypothetical protein